ncbi:hypothetical protein MLD38_021037 [Melastoma candidum]|uniref:Uncharacterized protein n=1 Tax=Melastoma candidum TaxID=119954 RepID=A0ACB9QIP3_9MYRT|nr:hypothetical protein MLD38_021037 [Melastoma candidum]
MTRLPSSVWAAISFGEVASKGKPTIKRAKSSSENALDKETQLLLAKAETKKIKQILVSAESTMAKALGASTRPRGRGEGLESRLREMTIEIEAAQEDTKRVCTSDTGLAKAITNELGDAMRTLQMAADEESSEERESSA